MPETMEIIFRTSISFLAFMVVARFLGKQTISQMTLHDFIAAITLGGITANLAFNIKISSFSILLSLLLFGFIAFMMTTLSLKSRQARYWLSGHPTDLMENGAILEGNMKKVNYTLDSLNQALREKEVFNIEEVEYAVLEPDGHLSILKKPAYRNVTKQDLQIVVHPKEQFPIELILDGKVIDKNLREHNLSRSWLRTELEKKRCVS